MRVEVGEDIYIGIDSGYLRLIVFSFRRSGEDSVQYRNNFSNILSANGSLAPGSKLSSDTSPRKREVKLTHYERK